MVNSPSTEPLTYVAPALPLLHHQWHLGDSAAYNDSTGIHPAAPSPKHYGIDASKCYVCNPDTPEAAFDLGDHWFPANSSRLLVDSGLGAIQQAAATSKPFYINLWFHISHAPVRLPETGNQNREIMPCASPTMREPAVTALCLL
jgi:hypothetical protein